MLTSLHIENIAIIRSLDIDFSGGFSVLTGETGAGKSIIIDAIGLISGARGGRDVIRTGEQSASVSAVFDRIPPALSDQIAELGCGQRGDTSVMLSRVVYADGRSAAKCNGRSVSIAVLRELSRRLIQIHGQHDNLLFLEQENHIAFLDEYAGLADEKSAYREKYDEMCSIKSRIHALHKSEKEKARLVDMLQYQIEDIDAAKLRPGEEERLQQEKLRMKNAEKIALCMEALRDALIDGEGGAVSEQLQRAEDALRDLSKIYAQLSDEAERLQACRIELEDIAQTVLDLRGEETEDAAVRLDDIEDRLNEIERLKRKYGSDIPEILAFREDCQKQLEEIQSGAQTLAEYKKELKTVGAQALALAKQLSARRTQAGAALCEKIMEELAYLDMEKVRFAVQIEPFCDDKGNPVFNENGIDQVAFYISTNPGEPLKPIGKVASGGELSRLMLAAKCAVQNTEEQTLIFDEVDTGVSGKTSQKIGMKMKQLAHSGGQVLCVTHAAQIAALGDEHFYISKIEEDNRAVTQVQRLDRAGRIEEVARIMGGIHITEAVRATAQEMLDGGAQKS